MDAITYLYWYLSQTMLILEQLERLRSEDTPCCPKINYAIDSYWIPSQSKTKSMLQG